jgi:hypothetical protein
LLRGVVVDEVEELQQRRVVGDAVRATVYNCGSALVPVRRGEIVTVLSAVPPSTVTFYPLGR